MAKTARYLVRMKLGSGPKSVQLLCLWRPALRETLAQRRLNACIDGFPRSANTYAGAVFLRRNSGAALGHHMHVPGQILRAVALGVPAIILIRPPEDAVPSILLTDLRLSPEVAIWSYIDFYRRTWVVRDSTAVCLFDEVVRDASIVSRRLNQLFGTSFDDSPVDAQERDQIFREMDAAWRSHPHRWGPTTPQRTPEREQEREKIVETMRRSHRLEKAQRWYARWAEFSRDRVAEVERDPRGGQSALSL